MQSDISFQRLTYSGLDPSLAFDIVYGGHFEHRLLSARHSTLEHQRLTLPGVLLETGRYDFPVVARGVMPKDVVCIGLMADGAEVTRYNTAAIESDEIQVYPSGSDLLYHATGASRWINFIVPETVLQSAALAHAGRPLSLPKREAVSIRLPTGGRKHLAQLADDAFALGRSLETTGIATPLARSVGLGLVESYAAALCTATQTDRKRTIAAQQHLRLILACERLAVSEDVLTVELDNIARRSGYGRRSLELIFNRTLGMPPGRWFLNIRLNGVMRELLMATSDCRIATVASQWGFQHLSRFAYQYHRAFGELPSATLNRSPMR
ncbi:Helix-turn-helix domain protein [compost metagenome]